MQHEYCMISYNSGYQPSWQEHSPKRSNENGIQDEGKRDDRYTLLACQTLYLSIIHMHVYSAFTVDFRSFRFSSLVYTAQNSTLEYTCSMQKFFN